MEINNKNSYKLSSGSSEAQGPRKTMEDTHKRIDCVKTEFPINNFNKVSYYAVYDGHGGAQTAEMVVESLHTRIFNSPQFIDGDIEGAIRQGFQEMDQYVVEEANKQNLMHGCTCVCCLVLDGKVYFANIGDSEGILISVENGVVAPKNMTKAHKANEPSEKERIESMGGHVFFGRVYGSLAVSRSFGDAKYKRPKTSKDFVSWEPHTEIVTLESHHSYMILACDGLFDVMNHQEVADMTHKLFQEDNDPASVAKALVVRAVKELQTDDNVTVIVVKIDWKNENEYLAQIPTNEQPSHQIRHEPPAEQHSCNPGSDHTSAPPSEPEQPSSKPEQPSSEPEQPSSEPEQPPSEPEQPPSELEQPSSELEQPSTPVQTPPYDDVSTSPLQ